MREIYKIRKLHSIVLLLGGRGGRLWASDIHITYSSHKYQVPCGGYYGEQALESGKPRLQSRSCYLLSHLTSDKFPNVSQLHFSICKIGVIIVSIALNVDLSLSLYSVTVVIIIGTS